MSGGLGSRTTETAQEEIECAIRYWRDTHVPGTVEKYPNASVILRILAVEEVLARCVRAEEALRQFRLLLVDPLPSADVLVDELDRLAGVDKPA